MGIRKATTADRRAMAEVAARAFIDDDVFGRFMHPHRREHYEDWISFVERWIWVKSNVNTHEFIVSIDEETGDVAAWAEWERLGPGAAKIPNPLGLRIQLYYTIVANGIYTKIWPDRSEDSEHSKAFEDSIPLIQHHWTGKREESWSLNLLCTDPKHERKGHGKALVKYGIDKAEAEGICNSVIAAHGKDTFYNRYGFIEVGRANIGPLAGVEGGAIMMRDAK